MDLFSEYKELYYKELEICDRLNSKIGTSITLLTIIGTGQIILWKDVFFVDFSKLSHVIYFIFSILSLIAFLVSIIYFFKAYSGYKYQYIPIEGCKNYIDVAEKYAKENNVSEQTLNKYISNMFLQKYAENSIKNRKLNLKKTKNQYKLTKFICIAFSILFISYALWVLIINPVKEKENKYIIINKEEVYMCDNENKIPDELQPLPPSETFHETFAWRGDEIIHNSDEKSDSSNNNNK